VVTILSSDLRGFFVQEASNLNTDALLVTMFCLQLLVADTDKHHRY